MGLREEWFFQSFQDGWSGGETPAEPPGKSISVFPWASPSEGEHLDYANFDMNGTDKDENIEEFRSATEIGRRAHHHHMYTAQVLYVSKGIFEMTDNFAMNNRFRSLHSRAKTHKIKGCEL